MNDNFEILSIIDEHIKGFCNTVAEVARERRYLAALDGFSLEATKCFHAL